MTKKILISVLAVGFSFSVCAQSIQQNQRNKNITIESLQNKMFYFFSAIENNQNVSEILKEDKVLKTFLKNDQYTVVKTAPKNVKEIIDPFLWKAQDIKTIGNRLMELSKKHKAMQGFIAQLRDSHSYANFEGYKDANFLYKAWELSAKGLDTILEVYGNGEKPFYAKIDSVSFDVKSKNYSYAVAILGKQASEGKKKDKLFFHPSLNMSLSLLYANHKDEAVRYEPLREKENLKAIQAIKTTDFKAYNYAAIVVLGGGPENYRDKLSIMGKINLQLAIEAFRSNKAPFIIVSGGHAHPYMTPYCEAVEMKKELIAVYGVPEECIIVEPYARHTTTNMRNATRLMLSYGIPINKKSLVVTNPSHSAYVEGNNFIQRCLNELGYQPVTILDRLSTSVLEFTGNNGSLHQNPYQPLDP